MLFWIFAILTIVLFLMYRARESFGILVSFVFFLVCFLISLLIIIVDYTTVDGYVDEMHARYDMLVYQYEHDVYDNDNDIGKRELLKDIQNWNEDLSYRQKMQDNFWFGIYYPDIYDQFELIKLDKD